MVYYSMPQINTYSAIIELDELQLKQLHDWVDGEHLEPPAVVFEAARQVAVGIPKIFYPAVGLWAWYQDKPAKIIGKTSGLKPDWVIEVYESLDSIKFEVITVKRSELREYSQDID